MEIDNWIRIGAALAVVAGLVWWTFIAPSRARRQRREELRMSRTSAMQAWDPRIYEGRRNR
jgi:hypothetical protein